MANRGLSAIMASREFAFLARTTIRKPRSRSQNNSCIFRASYSTRLSRNTPDLVQWIRDEGGFVHEGLKLENEGSTGLGLFSSRPISAGTEIISLPRHIPLALPPLDSGPDRTDDVLIYLAEGLPRYYMSFGLLEQVGASGCFFETNFMHVLGAPIVLAFQGLGEDWTT